MKTFDVVWRVVFPAASENTGCSFAGRCFSCSYWKHSCIHQHALCTRRHFPRLLQSISQDTILRCNFPIRHNSVHASHNSESFSFVYCCEVFHRRSGFSCGAGFTRAKRCVHACILYKVAWDGILFLAARHIWLHLDTGDFRMAYQCVWVCECVGVCACECGERVGVWVCARECVYVCECERVCVHASERESGCVWVCVWECVIVCECVYENVCECVCECVWECVCECVYVSECLCLWVYVSLYECVCVNFCVVGEEKTWTCKNRRNWKREKIAQWNFLTCNFSQIFCL